jgi:phosphotriesterase-related protein
MTKVNTLAGERDVEDLGVTYIHEHIFVLTPELQAHWPGYGDWDEDREVERARGALRKLRQEYGCQTIVDPTVAGLGRHVRAMLRAIDGTGLQVVAATGYYTFDVLPRALARRSTEDKIKMFTEFFTSDALEGMEGTDVRAGVLKCATDAPGLTPDVDLILRAVARTHHATGRPIMTHTDALSERGRDQQDVFEQEGVDLSRVLIGHCNQAGSLDYLVDLLNRGSYIGFDRCGFDSPVADLDRQIDHLAELIRLGWVERIMLAHDNLCFLDYRSRADMEARLPDYPFGYIQRGVVPALLTRGVSQDQIDQMLIQNPRAYFSA